MRKRLKAMGLILFPLVFLGCVALVGRDFDISKKDQIVKGQTTKEEIRAWFGEPVGVSELPNGGELWTYKHKGHMIFSKSKGRSLFVAFDRKGEVNQVSQPWIDRDGFWRAVLRALGGAAPIVIGL